MLSPMYGEQKHNRIHSILYQVIFKKRMKRKNLRWYLRSIRRSYEEHTSSIQVCLRQRI